MANVMIISGAAAYADPWHPFAETSALLRELISSGGHRVAISEQVERSLLALDATQLVVINIGNPHPARPGSIMIEIQQSLGDHLHGGGAVLGMHASATSFTTMPRWPEMLGGHWVRGTTMHPPLELARIRLHPGAHPVAGEALELEVLDERYSYLDVRDDVTVIGDHVHDGVVHPMIWVREHGLGRVGYDGLGHDGRSFDSSGHRALLQRMLDWLIEPSGGGSRR